MSMFLGLMATLFIGASRPEPTTQPADLHTQLMLSTFKLANPESTGTSFVLCRPLPGEPSRKQYILVSAEHAFSKMKGDKATLLLRKDEGNDSYEKRPLTLTVRKTGKDLWTRHPTQDVAVMVITPPPDAPIPAPSVDLLADDAELKKYEIHPGDLLHSMGYPHANQFSAGEEGFSVVRLGCLASFPLLPTRERHTFLVDFNVFEGDSGGPVYLCETNRWYNGKAHSGPTGLILGVVSGQHWLNEDFKAVYQSATFHQRLGLAIVVHASAVKEAIDLLPSEP